MVERTRKNIVSSWIMLQGLDQESSAADGLMWAADEVVDKALSEPQECWDILVDIVKATDDEWVLTNAASGPLETLLAMHPYNVIDKLEKAAAEDKRFRFMAANVWKNLIPDDVWVRVQKLGDKHT